MEINTKLLNILGLLADEDKFKVAAAISLGAGTVSAICNSTGLDDANIIKSIVSLEKAGLVENKGTAGYLYCPKALKDLNFELSRTLEHKPAKSHLDRFIRNGQLLTFPKSREDRLLVLKYLADMFEFDRRYTETEVNIKLGALHSDHAALRRYLVDYGFLARTNETNDGRSTMIYWRLVPSEYP
jgi:hypothetical protein